MPAVFSNSRIRLPLGQLFWREIGRSPTTLVFLHGLHRDGSQWVPLLEHLGERYHCLAVDLLGFGDSERPNTHYSIQVLAESLNHYLDALRLERAYLVGHSLGSWVAASYALQHPERVAGLVLLSPLGVKVPGEGQNQAWERLLVSRFPLLIWALRSLRPLAKLVGRTGTIDRILVQRQQLLQCPTTCELLLRRSQREIEAEYLDARLDFLQVPTLIVGGSESESISRARTQAYAALIPNAKLHSLADAGADVLETQPSRVASEIESFLSFSP